MKFRECLEELIKMNDPDSQMRCHRDDLAMVVIFDGKTLTLDVFRANTDTETDVWDQSKIDLVMDVLSTNPDVFWIE